MTTEVTARHLARDQDTRLRGKHLPGLDGVRALAIMVVLAFHLGVLSADAPRALLLKGGFLGVDLFFVLSGFLITTLLLEERLVKGAIGLGQFWIRRARRLLPALAAMIIGVMIAVPLAMRAAGTLGSNNLSAPQLRHGGLAALLYVANWFDITQLSSPFTSFYGDSPFSHCWSLSIEEQFYLLWPLITVGIWALAARRWRVTGLAVCAIIGIASVLAMALSAPSDLVRIWGYFATTSRAWELLVGAGLGYLIAGRPQPGPAARRALGLASPVALIGLGWFWWNASTTAAFGFDGGFVLYCVLAAIVIADVAQVRPSPVGRVLAVAPLRGIGRISYGLYLYHWPIFLLLPLFWHLSGTSLNLARLAVTFLVAVTSWFLLERPILSPALGRLPGLAVSLTTSVLAAGSLLIATTPSIALGSISNQRVAAPATTGGVPVGAGNLSSTSPLTIHHPVTHQKPIRVLVLGGTPSFDLRPALDAALGGTADVHVTVRAWQPGDQKGASPSLASFFLGLNELQAIDQLRPDLVIMMPSEIDGAFLASSPSAIAVQAHTFSVLSRQPSLSGLVITGYPGWLAPYPAGGVAASRWDEAAGQAATQVPSVRVAPAQEALAAADGSYLTWMPPTNDPSASQASWVRVQMINNVGLCPAGAVRFVSALDWDLRSLIGLGPPPSGWWHGSWTMAASSLAPPAWCPADSPVRPWKAPRSS